MVRLPLYLLALLLVVHGLIHLMGFVAYWPLVPVRDLPYKTALLGGRLELGPSGMRVISVLWLLAAIGFVAAAAALAARWSLWAPVLFAAVLLSLLLCILDWKVAFRGAIIDLGLLVLLVFVFGLRVSPPPFPAYAAPSSPVQTVPLPGGLPAPVERFYRTVYGDEIPVFSSAVISGRGTVRFLGITFPARLRFTHDTGRGYHHYIETTFYGLPVMRVDEHYLDGRTRFVLPFGVEENNPDQASAANQGLWGETLTYPAAFLTVPGVRWEAVDDASARLHVPYGGGEQVLTIDFNPQTGLPTRLEAERRFRDAKSGYLLWWGEATEWRKLNGQLLPAVQSAQWKDEDSPWLVFTIDDAVFNSDVSAYIRQSGL